jgi:hypothetical protein
MMAMKYFDVSWNHMFKHTILIIFMELNFITYVNGHMVVRPIWAYVTLV